MIDIDDGDIGYVGDSHISFRPNMPEQTDKRVTSAGTEACKAMKAILSKYQQTEDQKRGYRKITPEMYHRAIVKIIWGSA